MQRKRSWRVRSILNVCEQLANKSAEAVCFLFCFLILSEEGKQNTRSHRRAYHTGHVRTHGVHKQEVRRILLLTYGLRNASSHWHGRYTRRTDKWVDLLTLREEEVHKLSEEQTTCSTTAKCKDTEYKDTDSTEVEERISSSCCTNRDTEEDNNDIHQLVLCSFSKTVNNT